MRVVLDLVLATRVELPRHGVDARADDTEEPEREIHVSLVGQRDPGDETSQAAQHRRLVQAVADRDPTSGLVAQFRRLDDYSPNASLEGLLQFALKVLGGVVVLVDLVDDDVVILRGRRLPANIACFSLHKPTNITTLFIIYSKQLVNLFVSMLADPSYCYFTTGLPIKIYYKL